MQARSLTLRLLSWSALLVLLASLGLWLSTGASRGWTRTQITVIQHDEVTGIDYPEQRPGFVAGVDFLLAGFGLAALLATPAIIQRLRKKKQA